MKQAFARPRRFLAALGWAIGVIVTPVAVQAAPLTIDGTFSLSGSALQKPGLLVKTAPVSGPISLDLADGASSTFALFQVWTREKFVLNDDLVPQSLMVDFDFSSLGLGGTAAGTTVGEAGAVQQGRLTWGEPLRIALQGTFAGELLVSLSDTVFNTGTSGLKPKKKFGGTSYATFTYNATPVAATPLPASVVLLASGMMVLFGLGYVRRRSQKSIAAAAA